MCHNNPQMEKSTIWGFTEDEINHRWEVHQKFDPINRLFPPEKKPSKSSAINAPITNPDNILSFLNTLLPEGGA